MHVYKIIYFESVSPNITAGRINFTNIVVTWVAVEPVPSAGYEVLYRKDNTLFTSSGGNTSNTELTLSGLSLEKGYFVYVVAHYNNSTSLPSNNVHIPPGMVILL